MRKKRVYLAGPMSGIADYNWPAFHAATAVGREKGFDVVSPAEEDIEVGDVAPSPEGAPLDLDTLRAVVKRDLDVIQTCEAIALLPGWHKSTGAKAELAVAYWLRLEILDARTWEPFKLDNR
jgi:nucleoside 2-deoxyribosyltransferase